MLAHTAGDAATALAKVFCFFSSEKKILFLAFAGRLARTMHNMINFP